MTPGARKVLEALAADENCDLIQEGNQAYCGTRQTTSRVVNELLSIMAVSIISEDGLRNKITRYGINGMGRSMLRRPELEQEIQASVYGNKGAFSIVDDRIKYI